MKKFWIQLLALLTLLHQTGSASDTTELIGAVGGSVTFRSNNTEGNAALWSFGDDPIVTVLFKDPPHPVFLKEEHKTRFTVSERGRALSISQLRMEDAGNYSVNIDRKISTFILHVYRNLTEPTVTCEAQDCLDKVCLFSLRCSITGNGFGNISYTWRGWGQRWEEKPVVLKVVDKSSLDRLDPLTCTARNAISSRSVTVTTLEGQCPGAPSGIEIGIKIGMGIAVAVLFSAFLLLLCRSKGYWLASAACTARPRSASSEISATAGPGHQGSLQAVRCLGPAPGLAWDKHRTESRRAFSAPPETRYRLRPEPGLAIDQLGPEPGLTMDQLGPEPGLAMDQLGPEPGLAMDQL